MQLNGVQTKNKRHQKIAEACGHTGGDKTNQIHEQSGNDAVIRTIVRESWTPANKESERWLKYWAKDMVKIAMGEILRERHGDNCIFPSIVNFHT